VPLAHPPDDMQADFGEALVVIGGVERKANALAQGAPLVGLVVAGPAVGCRRYCGQKVTKRGYSSTARLAECFLPREHCEKRLCDSCISPSMQKPQSCASEVNRFQLTRSRNYDMFQISNTVAEPIVPRQA
jgi:hypothetical protein